MESYLAGLDPHTIVLCATAHDPQKGLAGTTLVDTLMR